MGLLESTPTCRTRRQRWQPSASAFPLAPPVDPRARRRRELAARVAELEDLVLELNKRADRLIASGNGVVAASAETRAAARAVALELELERRSHARTRQLLEDERKGHQETHALWFAERGQAIELEAELRHVREQLGASLAVIEQELTEHLQASTPAEPPPEREISEREAAGRSLGAAYMAAIRDGGT